MLFLHGLGDFHPANVIDNAFIESLDIGADPTWIIERVGIHARRTALPLDYIRKTRNADPRAAREASIRSEFDMAIDAAKMALERAGLTAKNVGMVVAGGSFPALGSPAVACAVAAALEIEAPAFDINSACSTFFVQLRTIDMWQTELTPEFILTVQPENLTRMVDYSDRNTAVLMGDGTTAAVVSKRVAGRVEVDGLVQKSSPKEWEKISAYSGCHFQQDGAGVQAFAIRRTGELLKEFAKAGEGQSIFVGHQANLLMLQAVCRRNNIADEHHLYNVHEFGNCGAAGAVSVLSQNWDDLLKRRALVHAAVVGAGLTWGGGILRFEAGKETHE